MKTKKKSTNTYKFQSFAQRVSNINVDVLTQSGSKFHAIPDDEKDSFFRETLQDLSETNCSLDFIALYRELKPLVGSFNLVVYHKDQIAVLLRQYLSLEGSYATKACLKLFSSLARDLQHDFFSIFLQMFDVLVSLLKQRDAEVHEDTFVCLAFVLKCTWRSLVQHISTLFSQFKNLLVDSQVHVQLFAAELFAFLISKSKQKKLVIEKLFDEAATEPKLAQGVGCVIFQTLKGIKYQFVLSARDILEHCLSMFSMKKPDLVYVILETMWCHSLKHTTPEHSELLFQVLYEDIEKSGSNNYTLKLLSYSVSHKHGYLIPDQTKLFRVMKTLFGSVDINYDGVMALVDLLRSAVETTRLNVDDELLVHVLSSFLHCTGLDTKHKLDTCQLLFKWRKFDEICRKLILKFVSECLVKQESPDSQALKVLLNFIMDLVYKDIVLEQVFCVHSVEMTRVVFPTTSADVDEIQELLIKVTDVSLWESDLQLLWSLVNCFCYCKFNDNTLSVTVLSDIIKYGVKLCGNDCANEILSVFAHCVKSLLILEKDMEKVVQVVSVDDMIQLISHHSAHENCLQAFEAFCTSVGKQRNHFFPPDSFDSLYKILKNNLSSPRKLTCSLTLRIFKYFDTKDETGNDEDNDNSIDFDNVFQHCLDSLDIEVFISTYQERLTVTRKLVWNEAMPELHCDVALRFLVGNLFVNFSLMWEPISELIASHAQGRSQKFWKLWLEFLDSAATSCCLLQKEKAVDNTVSCYSGAFLLCLDLIHNNSRVDFRNFRILLWKAMLKFSQLVERNAKDVILLYRRFMQVEYSIIDELIAQKQDLSIKPPSDHTNQHDRKSAKKGKVEFQALCAHLKVLSTFKKPKKIEDEFQLEKQYFDFLTSKDSEIQCLAISCLMTYAHPYMTPYKDNFDNLMIDSKFRDEMMNFSVIDYIEGEDRVVDPVHLKQLMPILIRLLYGKLQRRSGLGISGKTGATARQNIIMQFLINCSNDEVKPFFDIILEPFQALSDISVTLSTIDLKCVVPLRRVTGFLKMFSNLLKKLSGKVEHYLPFMFDALLKVLWMCAEVLKFKNDVHSSYVSRVKDIRRMALVLLNQLFEHKLNIPFNELTREIFAVAVWPQLSTIVADSVQCATPLLKMFVTWSKDQKYHSLLTFSSDGEDHSPLSCVYELLEQKSLSNTIEAFIMTVTLNLLTTVMAADSDRVESGGIEMLKPYITRILKHISNKLLSKTNKVAITKKKQMTKNVLPNIQFSVLSELSKLISDNEQAALLVGILFPLLQCIGAETTQLHIVNTINNLFPLLTDSSLYIDIVPSLFSLMEARGPRQVLCQVYVKMTKDNTEFQLVGELAKALNSWDSKLLDEPDYNCRLAAFRNVNEHVKASRWSGKQILPFVHIAIHALLTTDDLSLRNAASNCIEVIIESVKSRQGELFSVLVLQTIYPSVKSALKSKREEVRAEFISLLGGVIKTFQNNAFADMSCLCSDDLETDFFKNFNHIQVHRKIRALRLLSTCCEEGKITVTNMFTIFMPMITPFMFGKNMANKEHNLLSEAIAAVGCIVKRLPWSKYVHILRNYLKVLQKDLKNQKNVLRLLMVVLDNFHFDLSSLGEKGIADLKVLVDSTKKARPTKEVGENQKKEENKEKNLDNEHMDEELEVQDEEGKEVVENLDEDYKSKDGKFENLNEKSDESEHGDSENEEEGEVKMPDNITTPPDPSARIYYVLTQTIIPQLNRFLKKKGVYDSAKSNYKEVDDEDLLKLPMEFALSQLLLKLPQAILNVNLPGVLLRVSQSLKSHSREVRDSSRDILKKISNSLGASYLPLVLKEMKSLLQQGYQRHILGFTLHAILDNMVSNLKPGDVDGVVSDTMEIVLDELIGTIAEEKDVSAITGKLHEAQHCKSNATSELLAKFISNEVIGKVMDPIKQALEKTQNHTTIHKMEELLFHVANGLQNNESLIDTDVLVFIHCVVSDAMSKTSPRSEQETSTVTATNKIDSCADSFLVPAQPTRGGVVPDTSKKTNNHILITFGLHLLNSCLKRQRFIDANPEHLAMLDPIIPLIVTNLSSPYNRVVTLSLKCLSYLLKFQLPSTKSSYGVLGKNIFKIMKTFTQAGAVKGNEVELIATSFKSMTILVRDHKEFAITEKQLKILLTLVEEDIHSSSRQVVALPLLKSILSRKVKVNLLTNIILKVANLSIQDQDASVQLQCRKIVLQYLLDYPLGKKIVNHFDFYITHLSYEEEPGRVSALEMVTLIISHIPEKLLVEYAGYMFMPLVMMLVNDDSALCRKLCGSTVKTLLQKLPINTRDELFTMVTKFYSNGKAALHHVAVQLIGFFAEVEKKAFQRRMDTALPMFKETLEKCSVVDDDTEEDTAAEKSLYITLNCLVKVFDAEESFASNDELTHQLQTLSDLAKPHLLHSHAWIRLASSQLMSLYFGLFTPQSWVDKLKTLFDDDGKRSKDVMNANVKDLCFFFLSQLKDENLTKEIGNQAIKNLIFLFRVVSTLDPATTDCPTDDINPNQTTITGTSDKKTLTVRNFIRKASHIAAHESANNPKESTKRICVLRFIAAVSLFLGESRLKDYLSDILPVVHREIATRTDVPDSPLYTLAQEVLDLLQGLVAKDVFADVYGQLQKSKLEKKEAKKRKLATDAITNPMQVALVKQKRNLTKRDQRKRKLDEKKPERKLKKKRTTPDVT